MSPRSTGRPGARWRVSPGLLATLLLVVLIQSLDVPALRVLLVGALLLLMLTVGRQTAALQALLLDARGGAARPAPQPGPLGDRLPAKHGLVACAIVFVATLLGKWVLWTLRPDAGRLAA